MNREQKELVVAEFHNLFAKSHATFVVNYKGLDVAGLQSIRRELRQDGGVFRVTKARLMKKAAKGIDGIDKFSSDFKDQIGLVFVTGEVPSVAKKLINFSEKNESFKVLSGFFESHALTHDQINFLASLPSREVLLAKVAGTLQAPISGLARVLHLTVVQFLYTLQQVAEKRKE